MKHIEVIKFIKEILKQRHENAILDAIVSFALYFFVIIAVVVGVIFLIKVLPWIVKQTEGPIYSLFGGKKGKEERKEVYHHIDRPLKKLEF